MGFISNNLLKLKCLECYVHMEGEHKVVSF